MCGLLDRIIFGWDTNIWKSGIWGCKKLKILRKSPLRGHMMIFLKIIILCIWCNRICCHALKKTLFSNTVHYCSSSMPRLSQTLRFLQSPSFRQAQSALIGQLTQCIVIGRTPQATSEMKVKVTWHTAKYGNPYSCSAFYPSKVHTHSSEHTPWTHTHREHTPGAVGSHLCCGTRGAVWGSVCVCSLLCVCTAQRHRSRGIEGVESAGHSLPPPTIPAGPRLELATFRLWVRLSSIRPQLPFVGNVIPFSIIMSFSF